MERSAGKSEQSTKDFLTTHGYFETAWSAKEAEENEKIEVKNIPSITRCLTVNLKLILIY
jgi:hypothetical protein